MSELKDYNIMDIEAIDDERLEKSESGKIQVTRVYIKSDVDELIAKKDKAFEYSRAVILVDIEIIKKQKRKRCLAMAEKCHAIYEKYSMLAADDANWEEEDYYFARWRFFEKWKYRWLELAEKFK